MPDRHARQLLVRALPMLVERVAAQAFRLFFKRLVLAVDVERRAVDLDAAREELRLMQWVEQGV